MGEAWSGIAPLAKAELVSFPNNRYVLSARASALVFAVPSTSASKSVSTPNVIEGAEDPFSDANAMCRLRVWIDEITGGEAAVGGAQHISWSSAHRL